MSEAASAAAPPISRVEGRSFTDRTSMTVSWSAWPTCWAARPTPAAAYIVSSMFAINASISGVIFSTRSPFWRKAGWPYLTIGSIINRPVSERLRQLIDAGAVAGSDVKAAGADAHQQTGVVIQPKRFAQTESRVEVIARAGG